MFTFAKRRIRATKEFSNTDHFRSVSDSLGRRHFPIYPWLRGRGSEPVTNAMFYVIIRIIVAAGSLLCTESTTLCRFKPATHAPGRHYVVRQSEMVVTLSQMSFINYPCLFVGRFKTSDVLYFLEFDTR